MNVYFCDVCGVRVTDVDLHSGHGMRRRNDVICAACLELGHGREWAADHAQKPQLALAGAVAGGAPGAANGAAGAHKTPAPLDLARDRARTFDEDVPPAPVLPQVLPAAASAAPPVAPLEVDDTAQVPVVHQELSVAAAGFAALTPPQAERHDDGDVDEVPVNRLDESGASKAVPALAEADADADAKALADAEDGSDDDRSDAEKSETAVSARVEDGDAPAKAKDSRNGPSARKQTASSRVSKTAKSARGKKKPPKGAFWLLSGMSLLVILLFGIVIIKGAKGTHTGGGKIENNYSVKLKEAVSSAKLQAKTALNSGDLAKLESAHQAILDVRPIVSKYEEIAKRGGYDDEAIASQVNAYGVMDLYAIDRAVRDAIEIQKQRRK